MKKKHRNNFKLSLVLVIVCLFVIFSSCYLSTNKIHAIPDNQSDTIIEIIQTDLVVFKRYSYRIEPEKLTIDSIFNHYTERKEVYNKPLMDIEYLRIISKIPKILLLENFYTNEEIIDGTKEEIIVYNNDSAIKIINIVHCNLPEIDSLFVEVNKLIDDGSRRLVMF